MPCLSPKILLKYCFQFPVGCIENNAYAKFCFVNEVYYGLCESVEFMKIMIDLTCNHCFKVNRNFKSYWKIFLLRSNNVIFGEMYFLLGLYHISSLQLISFKNVS